MRYTVLIDGKPGAYGVVFPDLAGCAAMGATIQQAMRSAAGAAEEWIRWMKADGQAVPAPRSPDELRSDPEVTAALMDGSVLASIVVLLHTGKPVRANLSLDAAVVSALDDAARARGITRSAMVEIMAREHLADVV